MIKAINTVKEKYPEADLAMRIGRMMVMVLMVMVMVMAMRIGRMMVMMMVMLMLMLMLMGWVFVSFHCYF